MTTPHPAERAPSADQVDWDAEEEAAEAAREAGPHRRRWWIIGGTAVAVMVVMAVIWGLSATVGRVHWVDTGHEVVSGSQVDVRLDLRRDHEEPVTCRIEAQDAGHAVVGRTEVEIGPAADSPSRHVVSVRTAAPAITGYVDECWYTKDRPESSR